MNRKTRALLLNAFVLPGLGQLYLDRKLKGIVIILLVNLLLLLALFVLLKAASPMIAAQMASGRISPEELLSGLESVAVHGRPLLAAFVLLWGYGLFDIFTTPPEA
jgi:predicted RND superfamily exporter protein